MNIPKLGKSKNGKQMHYSVGAVIKKGDKYLLIDRKIPPLGFAGIAGHIDEEETEIQALFREIKEESGLEIEEHRLLFEEELDWNWCSKGINIHYWYLFECKFTGSLNPDYSEAKSMAWYSPEEIKKLKLEPVWEYWFNKLGVI
jgi:8-oxo-dGTP pyrophosphatase MutT (NUDIX family)